MNRSQPESCSRHSVFAASLFVHRLGYELFYWRTSNGQEIDFVLYDEAGIIAIEVKRAAKICSKELRGLKVFAKNYPMASRYMIYSGR